MKFDRPCICHWHRTGQLSRHAGDPGFPREDLLLSLQEPHHLQVHTRIFQGKLSPLRAIQEPLPWKAGVMPFLINSGFHNGMIQIQGISGVLWSKDSWFILSSYTSLAWSCYFGDITQAELSLKMSPGTLDHVRHTQAQHIPASAATKLLQTTDGSCHSHAFHPAFKPIHLCSVIASCQTKLWMCQSLACIPAASSWVLSSLLFSVPMRCVVCCTWCVNCSESMRSSNLCSNLLLCELSSHSLLLYQAFPYIPIFLLEWLSVFDQQQPAVNVILSMPALSIRIQLPRM